LIGEIVAILAFGEYLPDVASLDNPGLIEAKNTIPLNGYYQAVKSPVFYSGAMGNRALGMISTRNSTGTAYTYTGDQKKLYTLNGQEMTAAFTASVSCGTAESWEFSQYGDKVVATNYNSSMYGIAMGGSAFASLTACSIRSRHIDIIKSFLIAGNTTDYSSGAAVPNRVHWSGYDNINTWTPSLSTQSGFYDLQGVGGWIQKVIGGEFGLVIQERSIWRMTYVGPPVIFQFDEIEPGSGTPCPNSIARKGTKIAYLGQDGFYIWEGTSNNIGQSRVYKTFYNDWQREYTRSVWAASDANNPIFYWAYPGSGAVAGIPNKILAYNYAMNKWSGPIEITAEILGQFIASGYTLDGLDALGYTLDTLPYSFDDRVWMGGASSMAIVNTNHRIATLSGNPLMATLSMGEKQIIPGRRALITNVRPLVDSTSASLSLVVTGRDKLSDTKTEHTYTAINGAEFNTGDENRYIGFKLNISGDFSNAQGLEIDAMPGGAY
jgi:hypothetical protein